MFKVWLLLGAFVLNQVVLADPCDTVIQSCDATIKAGQESLDKYRVLVTKQDELILKLTEQRNLMAKEQRSVSILDIIFWTVLGAGTYAIVNNVRR